MSPIELPPPGGRPWTDEQRRAIERRDGDLLLDAGAGSGKTSVLVERFVAGVLTDGIDVGAMLTITFTEKAAAELRERIRTRLLELGADEAARRTEGAFISTIHGFCARLLRSHALAAGLDPAFSVLDRPAADRLAADAFDAALEELARQDAAFVDLVAAYGAGPLRGAILAAHTRLRSAGEERPRLPPCPPDDLDAAFAQLRTAAHAVAGELGAVGAPGVRVLEAIERVGRCLELTGEALWPGDLAGLRLPRNGQTLSTDACQAYSAALDGFRDACATRAAAGIRDGLDRLLGEFGARYDAAKRAASGVDFEDLELHARGLLARDAQLRERYRERFARIMVDEFQDTNRVQLELIELIADGNLFTVGDAQQSIYGFRHAELELFRARGARLAARGERETLQTNFRSRPAILAAINHAFREAMGDDFQPLRAGREPDGAEAPPVDIVLADKGADYDEDGVASPWRIAEARAMAARVAELAGEGWAPGDIVVLLRATTDMRAYERALEERGLPTYVIGGRGYWSHPQVVDLIACLRALANPRDEEALYGVLAGPMAGVSLDALVILAAEARASGRDPWWILREPAGELDGLSAGDREACERFTAWFGARRATVGRVGLEELIDAALRASGYDLTMLAMPGGRRRLANVRKLMRLAREHDAEHGPDLRSFLDGIADREAGRIGDARESEAPVEGEGLDAIRLMTIHRAKGLEFPVVVVADLGRSVRPPADILRVTPDGRLGLRLARAGAAGRENALAIREIAEEQKAADEAEERRLFYVAMTRARERLVLSGAIRFEALAPGGTYAGGGPVVWILPAFVAEPWPLLAEGGGEVAGEGFAVRVLTPSDPPAASAPDLAPPAPDSVPPAPDLAPPAPDLAPPAPDSAPPAPVAPPDPDAGAPPRAATSPPVASLSYSALADYERCGYRFYVERVLGLPPVAPGEEAGARPGRPARPRSAADRGVLLHALLERLDFRRPLVPGPDAVAAAAVRTGLTPAPGPEEADGLAATIRRFGETGLCARLARASRIRREERFAFGLDPARPDVLVTGVLDVLAIEPGGTSLVVDYKSDRLEGRDPAGIVAAEYRAQRLLYALAAMRAGARRVEVVHVFLDAPEAPVSTAYDSGDVPALEAELSALAAGVLARRFDPAPDPHHRLCRGCPAENGLCSWPPALTRRESADTLF